MRARPRVTTVLFSLALTVLASLPAVLTQPGRAAALANGLARTPPMGWNDWNAFACDVSESLVKATADKIVTTGMRDAGYNYVNIDDCWMTGSRNSAGDLVADPGKFPGGMKDLADYLHTRGLKLGIYEDAGTKTCAGFPGSYRHEAQDARLFASWGVDYLKYDWCNIPFGDFAGKNHQQVAQTLNGRMRDGIAASGHPMVFAMCNGMDTAVKPETWGAGYANSWRVFTDIRVNWGRIVNIYSYTVAAARYPSPGGWNDPDMLEVGNSGLNDTEYRSHFSLWAMLAAPLLAGTDLRNASAATMTILLNRDLIAVDQDSLGRSGAEIASTGDRHVVVKQLANGDRAVALFNSGSSAQSISTTTSAAGLSGSSFTLTDLWSKAATHSTGAIRATVPAHGTVVYRVHPA